MSARHAILAAILGVPLLSASALAAKLDKEAKAWLEGVAPIMLPDEEKTYRGLEDKQDRQEFQKIFWARRDPDLETPANEYQAEYEKARAAADSKYKVAGRPGSQNDCGRLAILMGEPDEVKKKPIGDGPTGPRGAGETWTYRERPGSKLKFKDGQLELPLDGECSLPQGAALGQQLNRLAEDRIVHPNINYRLGKGGHLVTLADQLPKPSPARTLLKTPRQDFPLAAEAAFLITDGGGTILLGMVRGEASGITVADAGGKKTAKVTVCAEAVGEDGKSAASTEQPMSVEVGADGAFVGGFRLALKPGKYTLKAGALEEASQKGSVTSVAVEAPDFNKDEVTLASVLVLGDIQQVPTEDHPMEAFRMSPNVRFHPAFGGVLQKTGEISFFYQFYGAQADPGTGKPAASATLTVFKEGGKQAFLPSQEDFDVAAKGAVIGPIALADFQPGKYTVKVKLTDKVTKKEATKEAAFEVKN